jgi:hypothetical protein
MNEPVGELVSKLCGIRMQGAPVVTRFPARHSAAAEGVERNFRLQHHEREYPFAVAELANNYLTPYFPGIFGQLIRQFKRPFRVLCAGDLHYPEHLLPFEPPAKPVLRELMRSEQTPYFAMRGLNTAPGWVRFKAEPAFELTLPQDWLSWNDYLNSLQSKYRVRVRRFFRMTANYTAQRLSRQEFLNTRSQIRELLALLDERLVFRTGSLSVNFFTEQFDRWGDNFRFMAYMHEGRIAGFITLLFHGDTCYALHACAGKSRNEGLYPRMLYDALNAAIIEKCTLLHLGKTAPEIKSSLGARAQDEWLSVYTPCLCRRILLMLASRCVRMPGWVARSPFKQPQ